MINNQFRQKLLIADFLIELNSELLFELEEGYMPFLSEENERDVDVKIQCYKGIPEQFTSAAELVFEAENEEQKYYSIYKLGDELLFVIHSQQKKDTIQQIAILDKSFKNWKVFCNNEDVRLLPLKYPLGPIIMNYMTLFSEAVMMHASCAFDGKKARIFTGFSGAGKSTMSKIWSEAQNQIVNDDRLIVRKQDDRYYVHNTPMYYVDRPKKAPLSAVYLISHSPENKIKKLSGVAAMTRMMAFSIQNNFEKQFIQTRLDFFTALCSKIPVYDLGFVPDRNVVRFILENEEK
ncbi:MAG: phosphoenolpyruvate carboxykinase (ATP) [Paludibacter sp.]